MLTTVRDRIGAATGALFVVLIMIGNQISMSGTDQSAHPSGAAVLKDAAHEAGSTASTIGFVLEFLGFVAFIGFIGYLADAWRRRADRTQGNIGGATAVVAGIVMLAIKLGSIAPSGAVMLDRQTMDPGLAQALNDTNGVSFVLSWLPFAVFVAAAAFALRKTSLVGRPTAYIGAFIGIAGLALALLGLNDPLNGNPMGFMLGLLWTLVVSVRLAVKPGVASSAAALAHSAAREPVTAGA
jgi:hypothetical protein